MPAQTSSAPRKQQPLIYKRDLALACALPALIPFAWASSDRTQFSTAKRLADAILRFLPGAAESKLKRISPTFDIRDRHAFFRDVVTISYYEILQFLSFLRPGHKAPAVKLEGREHLDQAYRNGKGAVLWIAPTTFGPMLTKVALKQAGIALSHLSRPTHGFSTSKFGEIFLNPMRIRTENKFLAERIVITNGQTRRALERITECLHQNRAVSITIGGEAKATKHLPFITGKMIVALRPIDLARQNGAALLPVVTMREADGNYTTRIGKSIVDAATKDDDAADALVRFIEPYARKSPEQFAQSPIYWPPHLRSADQA